MSLHLLEKLQAFIFKYRVQYIFTQVYQHCSPSPLLSKALVWVPTDTILHITEVRSNTAHHFIKVCAKLVLAKHGHNIDNVTDDKVMFNFKEGDISINTYF